MSGDEELSKWAERKRERAKKWGNGVGREGRVEGAATAMSLALHTAPPTSLRLAMLVCAAIEQGGTMFILKGSFHIPELSSGIADWL